MKIPILFNISVLLDVQANLPETSLFFFCPNGFGEHLFSNVYSTYYLCITLLLTPVQTMGLKFLSTFAFSKNYAYVWKSFFAANISISSKLCPIVKVGLQFNCNFKKKLSPHFGMCRFQKRAEFFVVATRLYIYLVWLGLSFTLLATGKVIDTKYTKQT